MKIATPLLLVLLHANCLLTGSQWQASPCVELNFKAADLQSGVSCTLLNALLKGGDILDTRINGAIDATCDFHRKNDHLPACVDEVADVVAGIVDEGCKVTGGDTVATFIRTVHDRQESYAFLTQITCRQQCFTEIQKAIQHCNDDRQDENCMNYITCVCVDDLLSMFETLPDGGTAVFPQFAGVLDKIKIAGTKCRCDELNDLAAKVESSPSCALHHEIVNENEILAGNVMVLSDTCNGARTCEQDLVDLVHRFDDSWETCEVAKIDPDFMYTVESYSGDFKTLADFACDYNECYIALRTCSIYYQTNIAECLVPISCECKAQWLAFLEGNAYGSLGILPYTLVEGVSADFSDKFRGPGASTMDELRKAITKCTCDQLNDNAASVQSEDYCALHRSMGVNGYMFADEWINHEATCLEPRACVEQVTDAVSQISDQGCAFKQNTDETAMFLYDLNKNNEWEEITSFVCSEPTDGCYNEIKTAFDDCDKSVAYDCLELASPYCYDNLNNMLERLSDDAKEKFLGIGTATPTLRPTDEAWEEIQFEEIQNETSLPVMATQPKSGASHAAPWILVSTLLQVHIW